MGQSTEINQEDNRPKWLQELENRKRKPRLAHEVGAGAPCIKCNADCPGLDLHFWRKICKNCKCGRDDHDVPDDEFPQFDLLFGASGKSKRKNIVLKVNNQPTDNEETFEWAPPDTTKELAADYMKALPEDKLPIKGSAGAALRKQQLQKQLPLHDIDHKVCDELTDSERKQFEQYVENLKKYAGQGKVLKVMGAKPFDKSLMMMTPANASECFTPKHKPNVSIGQPVTLRTPSSFVPKSNYSTPIGVHDGKFSTNHSVNHSPNDLQLASSNLLPKSTYSTPLGTIDGTKSSTNDHKALSSRLESIRGPLFGQCADKTAQLGRYHHILANMKSEGELANSNNVPGILNSAAQFNSPNKVSTSNGNVDKQIEGEHPATIESSRGPNHSIVNSMAHNSSVNPSSLPYKSQYQKFQSQCENSIDQLPLQSSQKSTNLPSKQTEDENSRLADKMLSEALRPPSAIHCSDIIGSTLDPQGLSRIREKLTAKYSSAKEEPVELSKSMKARELNRTNAEMKNSPIPPIHSECVVPALNQSKPIAAQFNSYRGPENLLITSENLHNPVFPEEAVATSAPLMNPIDRLSATIDNLSLGQTKVQQCHQCHDNISIGDVVVTAEKAKDAAWHPGCFVCSACDELLVDLVYFYYKGKLYCARDLANLLEIPRCFACDELIFVREYTVAEGHNYHVKHFCCWDCDVPLAGQQYISENDRPLCLPCYGKTYAKSCGTCNRVIAADQQGVAVKNLNFHASIECFCCASCKKSLLNGRMAIKEDKPFCSKECISMYMNENRR